MTKVSVIIPSYNSASTIVRTIEETLKQPSAYFEEIIVVDSSDDGKTPGILKSFETKGVKVIRLEKKTIPALSRNMGAAAAKGEILAFIDSDAYPDENWLKTILSAYKNGCRVGGGSILVPQNQRRKLIALAQFFLQFNEYMDAGVFREKKFVPSCNLFCERSLFKKIGGFPEMRASEDVMFGLAAGKLAKIMFDPSVKVYHIFREDLRAYLRNQIMLGKYILIYRRLASRSFIYRFWIPAALLPAFFLIKFCRIVARILASGNAENIFLFIVSLPLFLLGLLFWAVGFWQGCFEKEICRA